MLYKCYTNVCVFWESRTWIFFCINPLTAKHDYINPLTAKHDYNNPLTAKHDYINPLTAKHDYINPLTAQLDYSRFQSILWTG